MRKSMERSYHMPGKPSFMVMKTGHCTTLGRIVSDSVLLNYEAHTPALVIM
jgi:hypothetical protein